MQLLVEDLEIYRAAHALIKEHGEDAPVHAAMRADELLAAGDIEGRAVWIRIVGRLRSFWTSGRGAGPTKRKTWRRVISHGHRPRLVQQA